MSEVTKVCVADIECGRYKHNDDFVVLLSDYEAKEAECEELKHKLKVYDHDLSEQLVYDMNLKTENKKLTEINKTLLDTCKLAINYVESQKIISILLSAIQEAKTGGVK